MSYSADIDVIGARGVAGRVYFKLFHKSRFDAKKKYIYRKTESANESSSSERTLRANFVFDGVQSTDELMIECIKEKLLGESTLGVVVLALSRYLLIGARVLASF